MKKKKKKKKTNKQTKKKTKQKERKKTKQNKQTNEMVTRTKFNFKLTKLEDMPSHPTFLSHLTNPFKT